MGASEVTLLISAAVWTYLWGPIGLVLAMPITVCLTVIGDYVPGLGFLGVLLGDRPALKPHISLYQRLTARDQDEATHIAGKLYVEEAASKIRFAMGCSYPCCGKRVKKPYGTFCPIGTWISYCKRHAKSARNLVPMLPMQPVRRKRSSNLKRTLGLVSRRRSGAHCGGCQLGMNSIGSSWKCSDARSTRINGISKLLRPLCWPARSNALMWPSEPAIIFISCLRPGEAGAHALSL